MASTEAKLISKRTTGVTGDLAMTTRGRNPGKRKATSTDKCYNCQKLVHFGRDCKQPDQQHSNDRQDKKDEFVDALQIWLPKVENVPTGEGNSIGQFERFLRKERHHHQVCSPVHPRGKRISETRMEDDRDDE